MLVNIINYWALFLLQLKISVYRLAATKSRSPLSSLLLMELVRCNDSPPLFTPPVLCPHSSISTFHPKFLFQTLLLQGNRLHCQKRFSLFSSTVTEFSTDDVIVHIADIGRTCNRTSKGEKG